MIESEPGVYAIMRGDEAILIAQAETGVRNRLRDFEKSATTGGEGNSGGQTFFRKGLPFDGLRVDIYDLTDGHTKSLGRLRDYLITNYAQRTGHKPLCNTRLPPDAKAYL